MNLDTLRVRLDDVEAIVTPDTIQLVDPGTLIYWLKSDKSATEIRDILEGPAGSPVEKADDSESL